MPRVNPTTSELGELGLLQLACTVGEPELPFWVLPSYYEINTPVIGMHIATGMLIVADTMIQWQDALRAVKQQEQSASKLIEFGSLNEPRQRMDGPMCL